MNVLGFLKEVFDFLIPRFITEYVVLELRDDGYHAICSSRWLQEWEFHRGLRFQKWRSFNFFGQSKYPRAVDQALLQLDSFDEVQNLKGK